MLPLVLVVHVHTGEEDAVGGVGVDPAQEDDVLLVVDVPHILQVQLSDFPTCLGIRR